MLLLSVCSITGADYCCAVESGRLPECYWMMSRSYYKKPNAAACTTTTTVPSAVYDSCRECEGWKKK